MSESYSKPEIDSKLEAAQAKSDARFAEMMGELRVTRTEMVAELRNIRSEIAGDFKAVRTDIFWLRWITALTFGAVVTALLKQFFHF